MNNIIKILLALMMLVSTASAVTLFQLPDIDKTQENQYDGNIQSEFRTIDSSDKITQLYINLDNSGYSNNTALWIQFENNVSYVIKTSKYTWYGIPYIDINQKVVFQNYTIFNKTTTSNNIIPTNIIIDYSYDDVTGNTTIKTGNFLQVANSIGFNNTNVSLDFDTNKFIGLPSSDLTVTGLSQFMIRVTYEDIGESLNIQNKITSLSSISNALYRLMTLHIEIDLLDIDFQLLPDSETLLDILLFLDTFFTVLAVLITALFTYPWLILVWIVIIGNFWVAWKSTSFREIVFNYRDYLEYVGGLAIRVATYVWTLIMRLITAITNMIP